MISADQCRMARAALRWTVTDLAEASDLARNTVIGFEGGWWKEVRELSINRMQDALEAAGVTFNADANSVALKAPKAKKR